MFEKLGAILRTVTVRQSMVTTVTTLINGALGAGFYFLLARFLRPDQYGLFALAVAIITVLTDIADFGSNQALIRFIPIYKSDLKKQNQIISLILTIKFVSGILIVIITSLLAGFISNRVLGRPEVASLMPYVGLGVLAQLLFSFSTSVAQAKERFWTWGSLFISTNGTRIVLVIALFTLGLLNGRTSAISYSIIPLLGFLASLFIIKFRFSAKTFSDIDLPKIFLFNGWVTAFLVLATIGARVDTFMTGKLISLSALGIYALANQIVAILPQLTSAIGAVTSVKYSSFDSLQKNVSYTVKATFLTSGIAVISCLLIVPLGLLIFRFSGAEYSPGVGPMMVLLLAMSVFLITSPIRDSILYFFAKPQFFFWLGLIHVLQTIALSYYLIPKYQIMGSAIALLLGQILIALASTTYYFYASKKFARA